MRLATIQALNFIFFILLNIAKELELSASYISKALNNHPSTSEKVRESVTKKAIELKYKHNSGRQSPILNSIFMGTVKNTLNKETRTSDPGFF
jgi:DNA-binding LacI/PurR family transcriptional regulator